MSINEIVSSPNYVCRFRRSSHITVGERVAWFRIRWVEVVATILIEWGEGGGGGGEMRN
jgi:hypothetical protein